MENFFLFRSVAQAGANHGGTAGLERGAVLLIMSRPPQDNSTYATETPRLHGAFLWYSLDLEKMRTAVCFFPLSATMSGASGPRLSHFCRRQSIHARH